MAKAKKAPRDMTVADALSAGFSDLESLRDEVAEAADNMEEKFSSTSRYETMRETADALDSALSDEPELPDWFDGAGPPRRVQLPAAGRLRSRADRRDDATAHLQAARDVIQDVADDMRSSDPDTVSTERIDELDELVGRLDELISEAEGVEFPGMYG